LHQKSTELNWLLARHVFSFPGVVESVGDHVEEVAAGDTVVPVFLPQCGRCADCLSPRSNICSVLAHRPGFMPRDGTTRFSLAATGEPVHGFLSVSSFAEYTVVDVAHVVRLGGDGMPLEQACLLGCGVSTGTVQLHALDRSAKFQRATRADADASTRRGWCGLEGGGGGARLDRGRLWTGSCRASGKRQSNLLIALLRNTHFFVFVWTLLLRVHSDGSMLSRTVSSSIDIDVATDRTVLCVC